MQESVSGSPYEGAVARRGKACDRGCVIALRPAGRIVAGVMNPAEAAPFHATVNWLARHAGFPATRLPEKAEALVCIAALAAAEEAEAQQRFLIERRNPAQTSALRAHGLRRSQVHFKCDNSAKV